MDPYKRMRPEGNDDRCRLDVRSEYGDRVSRREAGSGAKIGRQSRWDKRGRNFGGQQNRAPHDQSAKDMRIGGGVTAPTRLEPQEMNARGRLEKEHSLGGSKYRDWLDDTPQENETRWQKRRRMRESFADRANVWDVSPEPPGRIEERFDVGADERKKKERKRKRKEERRLRREGRRAKLAAERKERAGSTGLKEVVEDTEGREKSAVAFDESGEEGEVLGPALPNAEREGVSRNVDYGKALRPGEGSKMAAFVQDGARIPRRGEIGLTGDEIAEYEAQGYVMSGSRNRRMEAVRIRKENQIYSAEELAALSQFNHEERKLREERIMNQFQALVESKIGEDTRQNGESAKEPTNGV